MINLNHYAKATTAAKAVETFRDRELVTGSYIEWDLLCEKLGGKRIYDERNEQGTTTGSLHIFIDGSCYYDGESSNGEVGTIEEFIAAEKAMLEDQDDNGNPLFLINNPDQRLAELQQLRIDAAQFRIDTTHIPT